MTGPSTTVFVRGLSVNARIGVYAHEEGRDQPLIVDADLEIATEGWSRLADTVNYERVGVHARAQSPRQGTSDWSRPSLTDSRSPASPNPAYFACASASKSPLPWRPTPRPPGWRSSSRGTYNRGEAEESR